MKVAYPATPEREGASEVFPRRRCSDSAVLRTIARALLARAFAGKPTGFAHAASTLDTPRCGSVMRYRSATVAGLHGLPCDSGRKRTTDAVSDRASFNQRKRIRVNNASTNSYASICFLAKRSRQPSLAA